MDSFDIWKIWKDRRDQACWDEIHNLRKKHGLPVADTRNGYPVEYANTTEYKMELAETYSSWHLGYDDPLELIAADIKDFADTPLYFWALGQAKNMMPDELDRMWKTVFSFAEKGRHNGITGLICPAREELTPSRAHEFLMRLLDEVIKRIRQSWPETKQMLAMRKRLDPDEKLSKWISESMEQSIKLAAEESERANYISAEMQKEPKDLAGFVEWTTANINWGDSRRRLLSRVGWNFGVSHADDGFREESRKAIQKAWDLGILQTPAKPTTAITFEQREEIYSQLRTAALAKVDASAPTQASTPARVVIHQTNNTVNNSSVHNTTNNSTNNVIISHAGSPKNPPSSPANTSPAAGASPAESDPEPKPIGNSAAAQSETIPKPLVDKEEEAADYIRKHPGEKGDKIAKAIDMQPESFRKYVVPRLKEHGFYNHRGYRPPIDP